MRILVVGSGGREHALCWKLSQEAEVLCAPGNPGIDEDCETVAVPVSDHDGIIELARARSVDLVVVGPEDPLVAGLAEKLRMAGVWTFGPSTAAAQHEGSKAWSKSMMVAAGVPTAAALTFHDAGAAKNYARQRFDVGRQVVVKASGAALGKGVIVCDSIDQADNAIDDMLTRKTFGAAGDTVIVEDRLQGREFSLLAVVSDDSYWCLPVAQDYKRVDDGDQGLNTGGMGAYSPVPWLEQWIVERCEEQVIAPMVRHMRDLGIGYRGVLFAGIMIHDNLPSCLEYNVRFGDPETQSIMMRLGSGLATTLSEAAHGRTVPPTPVLDNAVVTVVAASEGYPGDYEKGRTIAVGEMPPTAKVFHAGTGMKDGSLVTNGGRVLAVTAAGTSLAEARAAAYQGMSAVRFEGMHVRQDIAAL